MRLALITAALLIIPHLVYGAPETMQVNGESSAATNIVKQKEAREQIKSQTQRRPAKQDPSLIPCPGQPTHEDKLRDLAKLENHSTNCPSPAEGAIKQNPGPLNQTDEPKEVR